MLKLKLNLVIGIILMFMLFSCKAQRNIIAEKFVDNELIAKYYIKDGKVLKYISFNKDLNTSEEIDYTYSEQGKIIDVKFNPNNEISGSNRDLEIKNYDDETVQKEFLNGKVGVFIPLQEINTDELSTTTAILSSVSTYNSFIDKNKRTITIKNINKKYRFYPSELEAFIGTEDVVNSYFLNVENDTIRSEEIVISTGKFTRTYSWQDATTLIVKITFVSNGNENIEQVKKIILKDVQTTER